MILKDSTANLRDGNKIPLLGLGTWQLKGNDCEKMVMGPSNQDIGI